MEKSWLFLFVFCLFFLISDKYDIDKTENDGVTAALWTIIKNVIQTFCFAMHDFYQYKPHKYSRYAEHTYILQSTRFYSCFVSGNDILNQLNHSSLFSLNICQLCNIILSKFNRWIHSKKIQVFVAYFDIIILQVTGILYWAHYCSWNFHTILRIWDAIHFFLKKSEVCPT